MFILISLDVHSMCSLHNLMLVLLFIFAVGGKIGKKDVKIEAQVKIYSLDYEKDLENPTSAKYKQYTEDICSEVC